MLGIVEGGSETGLTKAEWEVLSKEEQAAKAQEVEARYLEAGADYVISGICGVPDKMTDTFNLWEEIRRGRYDVYLSSVTIGEIMDCPDPKRTALQIYLSELQYTLVDFDGDSEVGQMAIREFHAEERERIGKEQLSKSCRFTLSK